MCILLTELRCNLQKEQSLLMEHSNEMGRRENLATVAVLEVNLGMMGMLKHSKQIMVN
jgi:hypothetical protein